MECGEQIVFFREVLLKPEREDSGPAGDLFRAQAALKVYVMCYMCYYINSYLTGKLL